MKSRIQSGTPLVSFDMLTSITKNNPDFNRQLVEAVLTELKTLKDHLKANLNQNDLQLLSKLYHTIFPTLKMLGLSILADQLDHFRRPEELKTDSDYADRTDEFEQLTGTINQVLEELNAFIQPG